MARFKHETTNRKVNTKNSLNHWNKKSSYHGGWIMLLNKYTTTCSVCRKTIPVKVKIYWHKTNKTVMHVDDCTLSIK